MKRRSIKRDNRLDKLTIRSQPEVAKIMGLSVFVVQKNEYSAIAKLREGLRDLREDMQKKP